MPSKKKKYNARFPAGRIKKIMQTDEEVGKVAQAVPVIISRTLELFVESLLTKSLEVTLARNAKTLSPSHVKLCISAESRFDFLKDLVKNIPDISQAEEKESGQSQSADSSPNVCRFVDAPPGPSTPVLSPVRPPVAHHPHSRNGRVGDPASDCELTGKRPYTTNRPPETFNNGRDTVRRPAVGSDSIVHIAEDDRVRASTGTVQNTSLRESRPNCLPNFYTETLSTVDDEDPPSHSSVIRPNPDYSPQSPFAFQKRTDNYDRNLIPNSASASETRPPDLRMDLTKGFTRSASADSVTPVFHLDLSASAFPPTLAENRTDSDTSYTPSPIWQPKVQHLEGNFFGDSSKRSDVGRRAPPPLLKRSLSDAVRVSGAVRMPPLATIGPTPALSRSDFDKVENPSLPSRSAGKRKKSNIANEPPPLLPIIPTQKAVSATFRKSESVEMQLDEDYDT